jgi:hypothetical protein
VEVSDGRGRELGRGGGEKDQKVDREIEKEIDGEGYERIDQQNDD